MKNSEIKKTISQFFKFGIIGVMNTGVDLAVLNAETLITGAREGFPYAIQKGFSFLVAVIFSYFLNKRWTFRDNSKTDEGKKFSQFLFVSIIGMIVNVTTATVVVTYLQTPVNNLLNLSILTEQLWVNIGALCGTALGLVWNFVGYKFWVFKK